MIQDYAKVYHMLEDEESRDIYLNRVNYLISGDYKYLDNIVSKYVKVETYREDWKSAVENLRASMPRDRKIVLYGAGELAEKVLPLWKKDERFAGFCCRTKEKQLYGYLGCPVISPEELFEQRDFNLVVNTVKFRDEIFQLLRDGGYPEEQIFDESAYFPWTDLSGQYFGPEFISYEAEEIFVDAGCCGLETSLELKRRCKGLKKVYAFEPDRESYLRCLRKKEETNFQEAKILPFGTWSVDANLCFHALGNGNSAIDQSGESDIVVMPIDKAIAPGDRVSFIKMDVEGAELESLKGAKKTIRRDKPKLAICIYHKPEDMTEIPLYIKDLVPEYHLFIRHHSNYQCETVLYAIIKNS